jgi:uncharacterized protein (DUF1015 family)
MAIIKAFKAWRYHDRFTNDIGQLVSPLFDVVNQKQRNTLYQNPLNSIHISAPNGPDPSKTAKNTLKNWIKDKVITQERLPCLYVYYQRFALPGNDFIYTRKGFIAMLKIHDWTNPENVVLRHEATMPNSVSDRTDILEASQMNVSPTHGLYTDSSHFVEPLLDQAIKESIYETEDYQGVKDIFTKIDDPATIQAITDFMKDKEIILADGHHRYEGSLAYQRMMKSNNKDHTGYEGYNYHMMYFSNTESTDIRILPTHRLIKNLPINEENLLSCLEPNFMIKPVDNAPDVNEIILGKKWAFGLLINDNAYKIRLKPDRFEVFNKQLPDVIRELDLTVLHHLIIDQCLGIKIGEQPNSSHLTYERNFAECLKEVIKGEASAAFITQEISIETVKEVCYSGYTLPQKSTYFYPKVITGFLFGSIANEGL